MFAQWMHHAFPRQCPFRHVRGSADPQAASDWIEQAGNARASENGMQKITDAWAGQLLEDEELTHWTHEEESLVPALPMDRSISVMARYAYPSGKTWDVPSGVIGSGITGVSCKVFCGVEKKCINVDD